MILSILIPIYNNLHFTKQVIESIKENISWHIDYEVIMLDNWSTDWTWEYLRDIDWWRLSTISLEENIYVNPAWNMLAKHAKWSHILFLNNDITLFKNFDHKLLSYHINGMITCPYTKQHWNNDPEFYQTDNINWTCFLINKEDYVEIPNEMKLWWGDNYLYQIRWVKWIREPVIHWWSQTLNKLPELNAIIDNDRKEWIKICLEKQWQDNRFPETLLINN